MNDWGREPSRTSPRRGAGGILLFAVSLLCLAGGVALALGLVPLSQFGIGSSSADKDARIARLEQELDRALDDAVSGAEGDESYAVVVEQRDRLAGELADLKSQIGQGGADSGTESRLRQLRGELERSEEKVAELTTSLNLAEGVIEDFQAKGASEDPASQPADEGSGRIAELEAQLGQRDSMLTQFDAEITRLNTSNDALKTERDELQRERAKLQGELAKAQSHSEQLEQQIALDKETGGTGGDLATTPAQDGAAARVSELEDELSRRDATLAQFDSEIERLNTDNEALKEERDSLQAERSHLQGDLAKAQAQAEQLEQQVSSLRQELDGAEASSGDSAATGSERASPSGEQSSTSAEPAARQPRDPLQVASALGRAKGLGDLSDAQRDAVATALIEGECVADALGDNLDRVPVLAMRDMIRALESDC